MAISRRGLEISLGALWILDGGLQLQPYMFTPSFASDVIGSAGDRQAWFVSAPIGWLATTVGTHPLPWDLAFGLIQICIGLALIARPANVVALAASVTWGLAVWYFGEGLGGLTSSTGLLLTGAPGAALAYVVLSAAAWPTRDQRHHPGNPSGSPRRWLLIVWVAYWVGGSALQLKNGPTRGPELAATLAQTPTNTSAWLGRLDFSLARSANHLNHTTILVLIGAQALIGVLALVPPARTVALAVGVAAALGDWTIGQQLGQLFSGRATDPNTGPLVVLMAAATYAACRTPEQRQIAATKLPAISVFPRPSRPA